MEQTNSHLIAHTCQRTSVQTHLFLHVVFCLSLKKCILKIETGKALCVCKRRKKNFPLFFWESSILSHRVGVPKGCN